MTGFGRALRGELYALVHRRSLRLALAFVFVAVVLRIAVAYAGMHLLGSSGSAHDNFWPRFAQGLRDGLILSELLTLVWIASALPREIGVGAARDPLVRRISRPAFVLARALAACALPLAFGLAALAAAALTASVLFDAGHVVAKSFGADPETEASFQAWAREQGLEIQQLAEWNELSADMSEEEAFRELGLEPVAVPPEYYDYIPFLVFREEEVRGEVYGAIRSGLLPFLALGLFAFLLSVVSASGALAFGVALGSVLLFGVFLAAELGDVSWWVFADWLPGMGSESLLQKARLVADGYSDVPPTAADARRAGQLGSLAACAGFFMLSLLAFRRRRL